MWLNKKPKVTREAAVYDWCDNLQKQFSLVSRYDDPIKMYREIGKGESRKILLPRQICPLGLEDNRVKGIPVKFNSTFIPRSDEQARVVKESVALFKQGVSHVQRAPTGFGKTVCAMDIIAQVGKMTLVIVTKEDIRDQWIAAAQMVLGLTMKDIGLIQADVCAVKGKKIVIAMIQSLSKSGKYPSSTWSQFGLVIWDEVHRVGADHFSNSAWLVPAKLRFGLSATPERKDGKDIVIVAHIGDTRVSTDQMKMIPKIIVRRSNFLVPIVTRKIKGQFKRVKLPHVAGRVAHVNKFLAKDKLRNKLIMDFLVSAYDKDRIIIVFSELKQHLDILYEMSIMRKIPMKDMGFYIGGMKKSEREVSKGKPVIFATYAMTSEATDIPWLDTAILGTPRSDVQQIVGRVLREYPDKKKPIVFDIVDMDSPVFSGYYKTRLKWYNSIGSIITRIANN